MTTIEKNFGWLLMALLMTGCASLPLSRQTEVKTLHLDNPFNYQVILHRADEIDEELLLFDGEDDVHLQSGLYVLKAGSLTYPIPLLASLLPNEEALQVEILETVEPPDGFVFIPGGPTLVGDILGVGAVDERPAKLVSVASFFISEFETTNGQYVEFLNSLGKCTEDWIDLGGPKCHISRTQRGSFQTKEPSLPVVTVSYSGAEAYCAWLSSETGEVVRLPHEVEWEKMARGPQSLTYSYGNVYDPEAANQESGQIMPVGSFPATGWGVYDATGNAFEWTSSSYRPGLMVLRGGSYVLDGPYLRNSFRMWYRPNVLADDIGFRVLIEVAP